jgi:hypothetical protein
MLRFADPKQPPGGLEELEPGQPGHQRFNPHPPDPNGFGTDGSGKSTHTIFEFAPWCVSGKTYNWCWSRNRGTRAGRQDKGGPRPWPLARQSRSGMSPDRDRAALDPDAHVFLIWSLKPCLQHDAPKECQTFAIGGQAIAGQRLRRKARPLGEQPAVNHLHAHDRTI